MDSGDFFGGGLLGEQLYSAVGYWGMARSEMTFAGYDLDEPDMWHPAWTATLRPVSLPDEFRDMQFNMRQVFHDVVPYIRLAYAMLEMSGGGTPDVVGLERDLIRMERAMNAMSRSTVEGVSR